MISSVVPIRPSRIVQAELVRVIGVVLAAENAESTDESGDTHQEDGDRGSTPLPLRRLDRVQLATRWPIKRRARTLLRHQHSSTPYGASKHCSG
jgi:hypothetical protein